MPHFFRAEEFETSAQPVFARSNQHAVKPVGDLLGTQYKDDAVYPTNSETLRRLLFESGNNFDELRDPWGTHYREVFSVEQADHVLNVMSAGPDKVFDTKDDFSVLRIARPYFRFTGEAISRAVERFHARTGGFIRDAGTLKTELQSEGIDFDSLRDPWGQSYDVIFTTKKDRFYVNVRSAGPDKRFDEEEANSDDFTLWLASIDYLRETRQLMEKALGEYFKQTKTLPENDEQLQRAFAATIIEPERLTDPWGQRYYAVYKTQARYADRPIIQNVSSYGQPAKERLDIIPGHTADQFDQPPQQRRRRQARNRRRFRRCIFFSNNVGRIQQRRNHYSTDPMQVFFSGAKGAIKGTVTDPSGAVVAGVKSQSETEELDDGV